MDTRRQPRPQESLAVTQVAEANSKDLEKRQRQYLISMAIRVVCKDEAEQRWLYERFRDEGLGLEVKVVTT